MQKQMNELRFELSGLVSNNIEIDVARERIRSLEEENKVLRIEVEGSKASLAAAENTAEEMTEMMNNLKAEQIVLEKNFKDSQKELHLSNNKIYESERLDRIRMQTIHSLEETVSTLKLENLEQVHEIEMCLPSPLLSPFSPPPTSLSPPHSPLPSTKPSTGA